MVALSCAAKAAYANQLLLFRGKLKHGVPVGFILINNMVNITDNVFHGVLRPFIKIHHPCTGVVDLS